MRIVVESMGVIHERIAELWTLKQQRPLSDKEYAEFTQCLDANARHYWKLAQLKNLSLLASMTEDTEWQHEICAKIDQLQDKA